MGLIKTETYLEGAHSQNQIARINMIVFQFLKLIVFQFFSFELCKN